MATIKIQHSYTLSDEILTDKLNQLAEQMSTKFALSCCWQGDNCLQFQRKGADGEILFADNQLQLTIQLGFMLSAFKATLQSDIEKFIRENID